MDGALFDPCEGCGADVLEPCRPGCCGFASMLDEGSALIARALTVQASKLYALLRLRAELDDLHAP